MSRESLAWLNRNVLVGFRDRYPKAWHYVAKLQGEESNHYLGAIPKEDVIRRLFNWVAVEQPVYIGTADGNHELVDGMRAIVHGATNQIFKIAGKDYKIHQFQEWLLHNVATILDDGDLKISSAGLLRGGAKAWVMVEPTELLKSRTGLEVRPQLLAATSHDSSLASLYKMVQTFVVCDNTLSAALAELSPTFKMRHTQAPQFKIGEARRALDLTIAAGEAAVDFVDQLADIEVTRAQFQEILDHFYPVSDQSLPRVSARIANTRDVHIALYEEDQRCAPWTGTALGVFQTFNCYRLHVAGTGTNRFERNMTNLLTTSGLKKDREVVRVINSVTNTTLSPSRNSSK